MQVRDDIGKILELVLQWKGKSSVGRYGSVGICLQSETYLCFLGAQDRKHGPVGSDVVQKERQRKMVRKSLSIWQLPRSKGKS